MKNPGKVTKLGRALLAANRAIARAQAARRALEPEEVIEDERMLQCLEVASHGIHDAMVNYNHDYLPD